MVVDVALAVTVDRAVVDPVVLAVDAIVTVVRVALAANAPVRALNQTSVISSCGAQATPSWPLPRQPGAVDSVSSA